MPLPPFRCRARGLLAVAVSAAALLGVVAPGRAGAAPAETTGHLSGVVEDAKGIVLAGANVSLVDASGATATTAVSGKDGHYDLTVAPGTYTLVADARSAGTPVHATVPAVTVGPATPLDVVIAGRPGGLVQFRGRLVDSNGSPISGGNLGLEGDTWTVTDSKGNFALGVPPGVYNLHVSPLGWAGLHLNVPGFDLTRDRIGDLTLALVTQDVAVRDASGAPLAQAGVAIHPAWTTAAGPSGSADVLTGKGDGDWGASGTTDGTGHVRVTGLATANLVVEISPPGGSGPVTRSGIDGRRSSTVDVTVPSPPSPPSLIRLSGTATDADGTTPVEPWVTLHGPNGTPGYGSQRVYYPDAGPGAFTLDAPDGTYTLGFSTSLGAQEDWAGGDPQGDTYALSSENFRHDRSRQVALRLPASPGLTVRVLDPQGAPVASAVLSARITAPAGSTDVEMAPGLPATGTLDTTRVTGDNGVATLRTLPGHLPASVHVVAPSERGLDADVAVPAGASTLDVHLERGVVVSGTVQVGSRPRAPASHVALVSKDGKVRRPISVGADGTYRVTVTPGTYSLHTDNNQDGPGGESSDHGNEITDSSTFKVTSDRTLDLTFPEPSPASIRFVGADGNPLQGEMGLDSATAPSAIVLAPGITTTASAWFGAFGARDQAWIDTWPGDATVSGTLDSSMALRFSGLHLAQGGAAVVALAQGYSLVRPGPPSGVTAVAPGDGSATISWDHSADGHGNPIRGFYLLLSGAEYRQLVVPAPAASVTITGLLPNARYNIDVSAMTLRGVGEPGYSAVLLTPETTPPNPGPGPSGPPPAPTTGSTSPPGASPPDPGPTGGSGPTVTPGPSGYWMLESNGTVHAFGGAPSFPDTGARGGPAPAVHLVATPGGQGYWVIGDDGQVRSFGDAPSLGDLAGRLRGDEHATSLSATPTGRGYWIFTDRGRAVPFGDAPALGDASGLHLNGPIVGSVATPTGRGYYLVASDGGIFSFGDAHFAGSMGGTRLNAPVRSLVPTDDGRGYWLVAADGGVFAFNAPFRGSMGGTQLNKPVTGMVRYGNGYVMVGEDGGAFDFSDQPFMGSLGGRPPTYPIVAIASRFRP